MTSGSGDDRPSPAPAFAIALSSEELVELFWLLSAASAEMPTELRRLERDVEREIYRRFTIEELEQMRGAPP